MTPKPENRIQYSSTWSDGADLQGLKYWLLEPRQGDDSPYLDGRHPGSAESPAVPVIFLHGVGLGVVSAHTLAWHTFVA